MLDPIRPIRTVVPLQTSPRKTETSPARAVETLDENRRESGSSSAGQGQRKATLRNEIPSELLSIPQALTGRTAAVASYLSQQSASHPGSTWADDRDGASPGVEVIRQAAASETRQGDQIPAPGFPSYAKMLRTGLNKASVASSYRMNSDEPVYVPVPETVIANTKNSKLRSLTENVTEHVKDAYYRLMTMVPYSVGMFINVFA